MMRKIIFAVAILFIAACSTESEKKVEKSEITILSEKIKKDPLNVALLKERATYNKEQNNLESVLFDLNQCVQLDSLDYQVFYEIAEIYFELSKSNKAKGEYPSLSKYNLNRALKLNNEAYEAHALMGELMLAYAKYDKAVEHLNSSLKLEYNQAKTHMLLGYTFKQLKQEEAAINCFRNAINVDAEYKEAFVQLGQIYHQMGDTLAVQYYDNALRIDPEDEIILYNKALFYQSITQWNAALEAYTALHKVTPFHSDGHYNLGFIHMELDLHDVATNNFSDAIYSNSSFFEAYYARGNCFETLGNIAQAESDYKRAIEINPEYTFAIDALEKLQERNKQFKK